MFSSMNELLDQIIEQYQGAGEQEKQQYMKQMNELKKVSDTFIEQWLEFEEKFADFKEKQILLESNQTTSTEANAQTFPVSASQSCNAADLEIPNEAAPIISKGQGYYKLLMFPQAAVQFQSVIVQTPECNLARLFLGMTYMHMQNWNEAQRHFQLLIALTEFPKWLAMGYNALGCIQAVHMNLAQAEQLFRKAHDACPSFKDPLNNLKSCQETPQQLSLYFGSTELCCL
jgi:tetratricopeptide (TPR) repeat protein